MVSVLCQLQVKHYIVQVFIVEYNLSVKSKSTHLRTRVNMNFVFVLTLKTYS